MRSKKRSGSISKWFDRSLYALALVAAFILWFVTFTTNLDVVARYFFNSPIAWVFNINQHLLAYLVFFAAAWVLREGGHVKIDLIEARLRRGQSDILRLSTSVMAMTACAVLFWSGSNAVLHSFRWGTILPGPPPVHEYILLAVIPFGSFLLTIQFGRECWKNIIKLRKGS